MKRGNLKRSGFKKKTSFIKKTSSKQRKVRKEDDGVYEKVFNRANGRCEETGELILTSLTDESGTKIIDRFRFSHLLTKAAYPEARHDPDNLFYTTFEMHQKWEFSSEEDRKKIFPRMYQRYLKMKEKYATFKS